MSEKKTQQSVASDMEKDGLAVASQLKRRRLLKSTVAIPVIMTLHSGAALARTSNLVGAVVDSGDAATVPNAQGQAQIVCAIPDPADQPNAPPYDLGMSPQALLGPADKSLEDQAAYCKNVKGGILISATAFTSLQGKGLGLGML